MGFIRAFSLFCFILAGSAALAARGPVNCWPIEIEVETTLRGCLTSSPRVGETVRQTYSSVPPFVGTIYDTNGVEIGSSNFWGHTGYEWGSQGTCVYRYPGEQQCE